MKTLARILAVIMVASFLITGSAMADPAYYILSAKWTNIVHHQYGDPHVTTQNIFDIKNGLLQSRLVWGECPPDRDDCTYCGTSFLIFGTNGTNQNDPPYVMDHFFTGLGGLNDGKSIDFSGYLRYVKGYSSNANIQADLEISIQYFPGDYSTYELKTMPSVIHFNLKPNGSGGEVISSEITSSFMGYVYSGDLKQRGLGIKAELIYNTAQPIGDIGDIIIRFTAIPRPAGDLDGDCDVDNNDIDIIKANLNKSASVCPECDIDKDGKITVADARKLMNMCNCPRCICP